MAAIRMIQRNWRCSKWVRVINQMGRGRKYGAANIVQKYVRGWKARKKGWQKKVEVHLGTNFVFFEKMRRQM